MSISVSKIMTEQPE